MINSLVTQDKLKDSITSPSLHLVLGGARSGKSGYAEQMAKDSGLQVVYVATAQAYDDEMVKRIQQHQADRPEHWQSIEEPLLLPKIVLENSTEENVILVDCLTLWMMNLLQEKLDIPQQVDLLLDALKKVSGRVILVSNEISMGVVPMGELSRAYVDELGRLHQRIAQQADHVTLMVAGLPLAVKAAT